MSGEDKTQSVRARKLLTSTKHRRAYNCSHYGPEFLLLFVSVSC